MIQLFLKATQITAKDWEEVYHRILKITKRFPVKLERIESYNGFSKNIDKVHDDLLVHQDEKDEHISFWGDKMSYTASLSIVFYKHWEFQQKEGLEGAEKDPHKTHRMALA